MLTECNDTTCSFDWLFMDIKRDTPAERVREAIINKSDIDIEELERNYTITGSIIIQDIIEAHQTERQYDYRFDPEIKYTLEEYDVLIDDYYNKSWDIIYEYNIDEGGNPVNWRPATENGKVKRLHNDNWDIVQAILNDYEREERFILIMNEHNKLLMTNLTDMEQIYNLLHNEINITIHGYEQDNTDKLFTIIHSIIQLIVPPNERNNKEFINKILGSLSKSKEIMDIMKYINRYYTSIRDLCFKRINQLELGGINAPKTVYSIMTTIFDEPIVYGYKMIDKFIDNYLNGMSGLRQLRYVESTQSYVKVQLSRLLEDCKNILTNNIINDLRTYNFKYFDEFDNQYSAMLCFSGGDNSIVRQVSTVNTQTITTYTVDNKFDNIVNIVNNTVDDDVICFITTLPNKIELNELIDKYNNYFGTHETVASLSHKQIIRDNFKTSRITCNGVKKKVYMKK